MLPGYPAEHFPGTDLLTRRAVRKACEDVGVNLHKWTVPLEAIARYESDLNPKIPDSGSLRGMMQQSVGQYLSAHRTFPKLVPRVKYRSRRQAVLVAILYIDSKLPGYGGYGGIDKLLARTDRGPGNLLKYWDAHTQATYAEMRPLYSGY